MATPIPRVPRPALARVSLTRALIGLAWLLVAINVAAAIWDLRAHRVMEERRAHRDFANLTNLLAEQTAASLEAADLVLRDAQRASSVGEVIAMVLQARDDLVHLPHLASIIVMNREGEIVARTNRFPSIDPDLAMQPLFTAHRDGTAEGVFLSEPYLGGPVGTSWRFILSRRLAGGEEGSYDFDGIIAAELEIDSFDRLYRTIDLGPGGFIGLASMNGMLVTRVPAPPGARGQKLHGSVQEAVRRDGRFQGWTTSPLFEDRVLVAAAGVRGFPLFVATGSTESAVFTEWREEAWHTGVRTVLTSIAMMALMALAAWGLVQRERALQKREKRFRAMIEHSSDAVLLTRPGNGGIFWASPSLERLTGHSLESIRGREVHELLHPDQRAEALKRRDELLRHPGKVMRSEVMIGRPEGSWQWMESAASNLLDEPSVDAVVMNFRDITERKQAEAERSRLEQRLRQAAKMEAVGRLAGGIAHDFNNILGGILGYAEMLVERTAEGSRERRYAQNVLTAANRASSLVEQILSYSRSQRGKRVPVELGRIVAETLELVRGSLPAGIALETRLPGAALFVVGDPTQLHQIVMNLCANAIHAMDQKGTLTVTVEARDVAAEREFSHTTLHAGSYACLTVEDTGSGMDAETLTRLFEPFFTTKEVGKGTGLGLSLVYGIVTDSGGAIDVTSAPGRGSCFAIYLPRVDAAVAESPESQPALERGHGERVLVVDDEEALVAVTSETLKALGYEAEGFADGAAALAEFERAPERFDAVIADEVMPGLTGTELAAALRRLRAELPVVLVSGYVGPMMAERAHAAGVAEILKKPVQKHELAAAVARATSRRPVLS